MQDTLTEAWLNNHEVKWKYEDSIAIESVVVDPGVYQNIRLDVTLHEETVEHYKDAMIKGDLFPAIAVYPLGTDHQMRMLGGLHRLEAYKRLATERIDAYVVDIQRPTTIEKLQRTSNLWVGRRPSREEFYLHAMAFVDSGHSVTAAADLMRVKRSTLSTHIATRRASRRLIEGGLDEAATLRIQTGVLDSLGRIPRDRHAVELAQLHLKVHFTHDEMGEIATQIKAAKSDAEADAILVQVREDFSARAEEYAGPVLTPPGSKFRMLPPALGRVRRIMAQDDSHLQALTGTDIGALLRHCRQIDGELHAFMDKLGAL